MYILYIYISIYILFYYLIFRKYSFRLRNLQRNIFPAGSTSGTENQRKYTTNTFSKSLIVAMVFQAAANWAKSELFVLLPLPRWFSPRRENRNQLGAGYLKRRFIAGNERVGSTVIWQRSKDPSSLGNSATLPHGYFSRTFYIRWKIRS